MARKDANAIGPDADDLDGQSRPDSQQPIIDSGETSNVGTEPKSEPGSGTGGAIDPLSIAGTGTDDGYARDDSGTIIRNADGSPRKKRGRKPGSGTSGKSAARKIAYNSQDLATSVDTLSKVLLISHMGLANATKTPELALDAVEAKALAEATANVLNAFDVKPDPRFIAVAGLISTAASVYGPRIITIKMRKANTVKEAPPANTAQFDPNKSFIDPSNYNLGG